MEFLYGGAVYDFDNFALKTKGATVPVEYKNANGETDTLANTAHTASLRAYLDERLSPLVEAGEVTVNKPLGNALPNICNISVKGIRSEVMLNHLSSLSVYVSAGSACSAHAKKESQALTAFGLNKSEIESAVRISLDHTNTTEDIDALLEGIQSGLARLKKR